MAPQHGKSELVSRYTPAWFLGTHPNSRVILASYEATYAQSWGRKAREIIEHHGHELFGLKVKPESRAQDWWELNGHEGVMFSCGAGGPITGKGAELIILDDLIKNSEEAFSETIRNSIGDWLDMTIKTRLHDPGGIIFISTRWHPDDPAGRLIKRMEEGGDKWEIVRLPAIADTDEPWGRKAGEALCPELYRLETLREIERDLGPWKFATIYQQLPSPRESGGFFSRLNFEILSERPPECRSWVRAWDQAGTPGGGDFTVGLRMCRFGEGKLLVDDIIRERLSPGDRDRLMVQTAQLDPAGTIQVLVQDPGQAGKDQAERQRVMLAGHAVRIQDHATSQLSKIQRADPVSSFSSSRGIKLLKAAWNGALLDEMDVFPHGKNDDQIDALSTAFTVLIRHRGGLNYQALGQKRRTDLMACGCPQDLNLGPGVHHPACGEHPENKTDQSWQSQIGRINPGAAVDWRSRFPMP